MAYLLFFSSLGAAVEVMNRDRLKEKFPWLNVDDLECGSYGMVSC